MPLDKVRKVAEVLVGVTKVAKVTVVVAVACMVATHPKIEIIRPIVLAAEAAVMSMTNYLLIVKQLPVISPFCHLLAYQKRDMQVMVLL